MKRIIIILILVLIVIQFFRPEKNVSAGPFPNDISTVYPVPQNISSMFEHACNDCHSNNTRYPWYAEIQPVAWWLNDHVIEGKEELNFNEFATYRASKQYKKLDEIGEMVQKGEMPLKSYTLIHADARLSDADKQAIMDWANSTREIMQSKYPADSLTRPKPQRTQ